MADPTGELESAAAEISRTTLWSTSRAKAALIELMDGTGLSVDEALHLVLAGAPPWAAADLIRRLRRPDV